ncbi:MAG: right-handed parallel beta-helix repeat-containing protein [Gaiellaceae bacterium]
MSRRSIALVVCFIAVSVISPVAEAKTIRVKSETGFAKAARKLRVSGGTIVLRPHLYRLLVVPPRRSTRPLRIVGMVGVRVEDVFFDRTQHVSFGRVRIGPIRGKALVQVRGSRHILLHDLVVSAQGSRYSASIFLPDSRHVTIRRSNFSHCGDRSPRFANCVTLYRWSHDTIIEDSRFHDCRGCDFVHGRFGTHLTLRRNWFERALPCRKMGNYRCGHNDLVQLFAGRQLLVAGNHFGVYKGGGAQLYLTNSVDYATIVNNVFVGTDPLVPGYHARMGIVIGSNESTRLPYYAKIVNNTILTGARRRDGYAGSIRMSSLYGSVPRWKRPIVVNNVIALLETPARVCNSSQRFISNIVIQGQSCSASDRVGPANLDGSGRPRADSTVIDSANRHYAPTTDATGRRRGGAPDLGALEYRGRT